MRIFQTVQYAGATLRGPASLPSARRLLTVENNGSGIGQIGVDTVEGFLGYTPVNKAGDTMTGALVVQANLTGRSAIRLQNSAGLEVGRWIALDTNFATVDASSTGYPTVLRGSNNGIRIGDRGDTTKVVDLIPNVGSLSFRNGSAGAAGNTGVATDIDVGSVTSTNLVTTGKIAVGLSAIKLPVADIVTGNASTTYTPSSSTCMRLRSSNTDGNCMVLTMGVSTASMGGSNQGHAYIQQSYWGGANTNVLLINPLGGPILCGGVVTAGSSWAMGVNNQLAIVSSGNGNSGASAGEIVFCANGYVGTMAAIRGIFDSTSSFTGGMALTFRTAGFPDLDTAGSNLSVERLGITSRGLITVGNGAVVGNPAFKPSGANLNFRKGDDSADTGILAADITSSSGYVYLDTDVRYKRTGTGTGALEVYNATSGWQTGVKVETNTSGVKLGFYGHAGSFQSAAYTVSNDVASRTLDLNDTSLGNLGNVLGTLIKDLKGNGIIG